MDEARSLPGPGKRRSEQFRCRSLSGIAVLLVVLLMQLLALLVLLASLVVLSLPELRSLWHVGIPTSHKFQARSRCMRQPQTANPHVRGSR